MRPDKQWPTIELTFVKDPGRGAWDQFVALSGAATSWGGVEELGSIFDEKMGPPGARFFFPVEADMEKVEAEFRELIENIFPHAPPYVELSGVEDSDWATAWRDNFHLQRVSQRFYVAPPWETEMPADAPENAQLIQIEPGQAFGTGTHESTQLCLSIIDERLPIGNCLLDVGAGSGILSIGAIMLGWKYAVAAEFDPVCEENLRKNLELNGCEANVLWVKTADPREAVACIDAKMLDCVVCNMLSHEFIPLLPVFKEIGRPAVISGFMASESAKVRKALDDNGMRVVEEYQHTEWEAFIVETV